MRKVGFIGWRGMVGSVLMERMRAENDFNGYEPLFFTTSQVGQAGPDIGRDIPPLQDALKMPGSIIFKWVFCEGGSLFTTLNG